MDRNTRILGGVALIAVIIIAVVILGASLNNTSPKNVSPKNVSVACTMEAKLCPDGSAVGRVGPSCEFAPCPTAQGCTKDLKVCPDGNTVSRVAPSCEFALCPAPAVPSGNDCASGQYASSDCDGACAASHECKQVVNTACYACASRVLDCYEWSMYPTESECRSNCVYPNWCTFSNPGCWKCNEPYDIRP